MAYIGQAPTPLPLTASDIPDLPATKITSGTFPALNGSNLTSLTAGNLTGSLPAISGASLTGVSAGKVLQVVQSTNHLTHNTTSTSFVDIDSSMSVSITPSSTSNKVLVSFNAYLSNTSSNTWWVRLLRGTDVIGNDQAGNGIDSGGGNASQYNRNKANMTFLDSPNANSSQTYKLQWKCDGNTLYINRVGAVTSRGGRSHITVMEIEV